MIDPFGLEVGVPYSTADAASMAAINMYNAQSVKTDQEAIGIVFKFKGSYYHTPAKWGQKGEDSSSLCNDDLTYGDDLKAGQVPPSVKKPEGLWHTHGGPGGIKFHGIWPGYKNAENFSAEDLMWLLNGSPIYLGTPKGYIKKASPLAPGEIGAPDFWGTGGGFKNYNETILQTPKR